MLSYKTLTTNIVLLQSVQIKFGVSYPVNFKTLTIYKVQYYQVIKFTFKR